jgi:hypothetical protein
MRARPQGKCESNKKLNSIDESSADKDSQANRSDKDKG